MRQTGEQLHGRQIISIVRVITYIKCDIWGVSSHSNTFIFFLGNLSRFRRVCYACTIIYHCVSHLFVIPFLHNK